MGSHKRGPWSTGEDGYLLQLVQTQGAHNWVRISQMIGSRSPKQCRERFHQNLKPSLNHDPITPEEGAIIERLVGEMGKRWAEIARRLRGRSDNAVKNWWNGGMNRRRRIVVRREGSSHSGQGFDEKTQKLSYARPIYNALPRPVKHIMISSPQRRVEAPLISPASSQVSMTDSIGDTPSLVSDSSSHISASPNIARFTPRLPPPRTPRASSYGPTLPSMQFRASDLTYHNTSSQIRYTEQRLHQFADVATSHSTRQSLGHSLRYLYPTQPKDGPQPQCQLPPFQSLLNNAQLLLSNPAKRKMSVSAILD